MSAAVAWAEPVRWQQIHVELQQLAIEQASRDYELGRLLLGALREQVHLHLGLGSFSEYVERLFGLTPRQVGERLRVACALRELPELREALRQGAICWSVVRELTRVAVPETEAEWIAASRRRTARDIERMVAGRKPGDRPSDPADPAVQKQVLRFEVTAEVAAIWREAVAELKRRTGPAELLSEEEALLLMARAVLGGPGDEGRAGYQIAMTVCERCGQGFQESRGELVPVGPEVVELATCDAQHIGAVGDTHVRTGAAWTDTHVGTGAAWIDTHVGTPRPRARATQSIPPRTRRSVVRRHNGQCAVPGCRNAAYLDVHHLRPKADGGGSGEDDLVLICGCHHRAVHRGFLIIEGRPSMGLEFFHADGSPYGGDASPAAIEAHGAAYHALKGLGFRESDIRRALDHVRAGPKPEAPLDEVLRAALAVLME